MGVLDIKVPGVGESVQEGMIDSWLKKSGDIVQQDEVLLELETDKATVEVVAEASGCLEILIEAGETVSVGDVVGKIDTDVKKQEVDTSLGSKSKKNRSKVAEAEGKVDESLDPGPAVRHMTQETGVDLTKVLGTGRGGRVTKEDLLTRNSEVNTLEKTDTLSGNGSQVNTPVSKRNDRRESMSMIRRRIAERLIDSQKNAAILTTFNEVDMTSILNIRKNYKDSFLDTYGIKLGFMGFFLKASVSALQKYPLVNAYIEGTDIVYHDYCDIGVAVSTQKGLMVPVLKDVQSLSVADIERNIAEFAEKARSNKISLDDLKGGTFTVSNGGVFGSLLSTPILNPPQSAILGMHKTQMRAVVTASGDIVAKPMMYLALSYDHRIVDGKEAVGFLVRIKECIEDPSRLVIGV